MTLLERLNTTDRFAASIGARLTEVREGYARAELTVEERHLNGAGVCQGGVMFTLADLAFAAVANGHGILSVGVSNNITYLRSGKLGDTIVAECHERVNHHKLPFCDITITDGAGETLAIMTGLAYRTKNEFPFDNLQ
ncbi:MAG: PaaI family thioesterase [Bacteroidales bacterium]|nr:PaaI family thioesterase [Bacteroidales bacterium]